MSLIKSGNNSLTITTGHTLAIIDEQGQIVEQGKAVEQQVFDAMTDQVINVFCSRFKPLNPADFKKVA
jgi:N-acetyl-anhydromuramyl-L-alanine amidase AmpD